MLLTLMLEESLVVAVGEAGVRLAPGGGAVLGVAGGVGRVVFGVGILTACWNQLFENTVLRLGVKVL